MSLCSAVAQGAKYVAWTLAKQGKLHRKEMPELQELLARRADALAY
jgi:hypothetical protein